MTTKTDDLTHLIREVRTCFNQLRSLAEGLSADLNVNPSMRAIMEGLFGERQRTVPDLAKERGASRQHVQKVINGLLDQGLVRTVENPSHKRSVLYVLTPHGEQVFTRIRQREAAPMQALSEVLGQAEVKAATKALTTLNHQLDQLINQGERK